MKLANKILVIINIILAVACLFMFGACFYKSLSLNYKYQMEDTR